jgi:hypothetical protein
MSAFNILQAEAACPTCGCRGRFEIQFKYGDTWQYEYRIGDRLCWGGNDIGKPGLSEVQVQGVGGPCPNCGAEGQPFALMVKKDEIVAVRPASEDEYSAMEPLGFRVVSSGTWF